MTETIILVGAPFSTFTRTVRMVLHHLNVTYELEETMPHSETAYKYNPFGRLPSLIHKDRVLFETAAIRDYVDSTINSSLTPQDLNTRLKMDQLVSVLCDYIFHHVVFGIAKPREYYEMKGKPESEIAKLLEKPTRRAAKIIGAMDGMVDENGPFLCGQQLTWADYFVYPAIADIFSLPEGKILSERAPKLMKWYKHFKERDEAIRTYPDTIADIRNRKSNL